MLIDCQALGSKPCDGNQHSAENLHVDSETLRSVLDSMFAFVCLLSVDGRVLEVNRAPLEAAGLRRVDVIGQKFVDTYWWSYSRQAQEQLLGATRRAASGETIRDDFRVRVAAERTIVVDATFGPLRDESGRVTQIVGSGVDVTARKRAEEALADSELCFRQVVENIREVFWMTDLSGERILYVSPAYEHIWGRPCESLYDAPHAWTDAIQQKDRERVLQAWENKRASDSFDEEYTIVRPDGSLRRIRDRAFPVRDAQGVIYRIAGVAEDITEQSRLQEQLLRSQKMEAIGRLAGGIAHDFNNLVTVINGYSQILLDELPTDGPHRSFVAEIRDAGERSAALTRQILAFSRKQVLAPTVLDLNAVVRETEKLLRRILGEDVEVTTVLHPRLGSIKVDPTQMEQVLLNLIVNARDAMPQGGKVVIETSNVDWNAEFGRERPGVAAGRYIMLAVTDSGIGMTEEIKRHLFEPFFTTKTAGKGTGLGLAVVHGIVEQSNGFVEVASQLGAGTSFKVYLPRVEQLATPRNSFHDSGPTPRGHETILITEDEESVRLLTRRVLAERGYVVLQAANAEEALELIDRCPQPIHLLLTDVVLPGMGGRLLAARVQARQPGTKVLYMSGYNDDAIVRHGITQEQVQLLQKPFSSATLARKVRELLDAAAECQVDLD